jgi:exodeoxyribonuclease VII small subunit
LTPVEPPPTVSSMPQKKKEPTFEEIVARLEAIAKQLESGEAKLEESLALFEEGVTLVRAGKERLDQAEKKLEILREGDRPEPFSPEKDSADS